MKLFLTVTLLVSAFAYLNAEGIEEIQQDLENLREELTAINDAQKPVWQKIKVSLIEANRYFATLVEAAAEEVKNGNKDLEAAKQEMLDQLDELSQNYTDEATPPYRAWESALQETVTKMIEKLSKLTREDQELVARNFENINFEANRQFDSIFRPVNGMVGKNIDEGKALIKRLLN